MQTMEMEQIITTEKPFILETPEGIFRVKKAYDDGAESPREWDGNLATMTCWHRQYTLGDKHEFETPDAFLSKLMLDTFSHDALHKLLTFGNFSVRMTVKDGETVLTDGKHTVKYYTEEQVKLGWPEEDFVEELGVREKLELLQGRDDLLLLPIYLYDHSGLAMSMSDFGDRWDSGQVGFIYTDRARYEEVMLKKEDAEWKAHAKEKLQREVAVYSDYLGGSVYSVFIDSWIGPKDADPEDFMTARPYWDREESCGGFIGLDDRENGVLDFIREITGLED